MKLLELFSGTHSVGKVAKTMGYHVTSVDMDMDGNCPFGTDYVSDHHIQTNIMTWDYKSLGSEGEFEVITASPVCLWWSKLRDCWINRVCKKIRPDGERVTLEDIYKDIDEKGKPMVDKVFEILDYFKPKYFWIENPQTGKMKDYITELDYYDVDYCMYGLPYKKRTRFWTNIKGFEPKKCDGECGFIIKKNGMKVHQNNLGNADCRKRVAKHITEVQKQGGGKNRHERYRVPFSLIKGLLKNCVDEVTVI